MQSPRLKIAFHLHAYQPPTQKQEVISQVFSECYEPIIGLAEKLRHMAFSLDITKSLGEKLPPKFLTRIKELYRAGRLELINTAAYHYLLPLIPENAVARQLKLNEEFYRENFIGDDPLPGVFLPELAYAPNLPKILRNSGYRWCLADDAPYEWAVHEKLSPPYRIPNTHIIEKDGCAVFLRSRQWSDDISFQKGAYHCCGAHFLQELIHGQEQWNEAKSYAGPSYTAIALDMETFGHHQKNGIEKFLMPFFMEAEQKFHRCRISSFGKISEKYPKRCADPDIPAGTWSTSYEDFCGDTPYPLWSHPQNHYHRAWNEFLRLALAAAPKNPEPKLQDLLDTAFYSCSPWHAAKTEKKNREVASWCLPMFEKIINCLAGHDSVPQLRYYLEEMRRFVI